MDRRPGALTTSGRRWLKLGLGLLSLGAAVAIGFWWMSRPEYDAFRLESAGFADPEFLRDESAPDGASGQSERFAVGAHRLARGTGTIYAWRRFSDEGPQVIDEEVYEKLTIWTRRPVPTGPLRIGLDDPRQVLVVYGSGGSAWPNAGCVGFVRQGSLRLVPAGAGHVVLVQGTLEPVPWGSRLEPCRARPFRQRFRAAPMRFEDLTPWLGRAAPHPYDETYR
jgi:hypothetical protein